MPDPLQSISKRPRGRPTGTAPYEQQDIRLLTRFADAVINSPDLNLSAFLKRQGYKEHQIRRARKRWNDRGEALLEDARLRADAAPPARLLDMLADLYHGLSALADAARPGLELLAESLEKSRRRAHAKELLGLSDRASLSLSDEEAVRAALDKFQSCIVAGNHPKELDGLNTDDLPRSLKLYYVAVMVHQLSVQVAESEQRSAPESKDIPQSKGEAGQ